MDLDRLGTVGGEAKASSARDIGISAERIGATSIRPAASSAMAVRYSSWKRKAPTKSISRAIRRLAGTGTSPGGIMPSCTTRPPGRTTRNSEARAAGAPVASSATSNVPLSAS